MSADGGKSPKVAAGIDGAAPFVRLAACTIRFGGLAAVQDLDMEVQEGEIYGLIGPNGAGKTTVFNLLTGVYRPSAGSITLDGHRIDGLAPHRIARLGVSRTFQNIRLFAGLSVLENVLTACHLHARQRFADALLRTPRFVADEREQRDFCRHLLAAFGLERKAQEAAIGLSYGDQRRLELARALATRPRLLALDEPAAGMNPAEAERLMELIRSLRERHRLTILLVEHNMKVVMGVCERIQVMDYGRSIALGPPAAIGRDPRVIEAYLGY